VTVHADVDGAELRQSATINFSANGSENPEIERMWAFHRVQRLLREADRTGSRADVVPEIVRLGEAYSIMSEYTSFLVLENDTEYRRWKLDRQNALRVARDRKGQRDLDTRLAALRKAVPEDLGSPVDVGPNVAAQPAAQRSQPALTQPGSTPRGGSSGGGALDPLTGAITLGLSALALMRHRRRGRDG